MYTVYIYIYIHICLHLKKENTLMFKFLLLYTYSYSIELQFYNQRKVRRNRMALFHFNPELASTCKAWEVS